ncbi:MULTISPECIES: Lrp/AsnC family transcriptional regulator [Psychromonas]|uniref:Lrp/AsnC ligand binding domain-containing protein n=1 Tax=Psychromonas TaxID=67572 RepID=UPI00040EA6A2|nr:MULTISPECIES: Lrp/AsnC family transcriptional regulator [Psychromonas]
MTLIVSIEMERDRAGIYEKFKYSMIQSNEIMQCYQISGSYDFVVIVCVQDIQAYETFVDRALHDDLNIRKFDTSVASRTVKHSTAIQL